MFEKIINRFIKNPNEIENPEVRAKYGILTGVFGIILNTVLSALKITIGLILGAISVVSDGINNLSDAGSSVITMVGFRLANKKPDKEHPYGHGRIEYFAGLIVSIIILLVAVELFIGSLKKVINGETLFFESNKIMIITAIILTVSIVVKTFMTLFYRYTGKKIKSSAIMATSLDCITDCISTFVVLICTLLSSIVRFPLDGIGGIIVSLFIAYTGLGSVKKILDLLLGEAPDKEFVKKIKNYVLTFDERVVGIHDLMLHDYGSGRKIIVLHVEVPSDNSIVEMHNMIDGIERGIEQNFNCMATIHIDPVEIHSENVKKLYEVCMNIVKGIDENFDIHDFRINDNADCINVIFDLLITYDRQESKEQLKEIVSNKIRGYDKNLNPIITVDYPMV